MSEETTAVMSDTASATVDATSTQDGSSQADAASIGDAGPAAPRTYTPDQVSEVVRKRLAEADRKWKAKEAEYAAKEKQFVEMATRMNSGIEAMGKGFGFIQEQPKEPWKEEIQSLEQKVLQQFEERESKLREQAAYTQMVQQWRQIEATVPEAKLPGFKQAWAEKWDFDSDPMTVAKNLATEFEKYFAAKSNASVEEKDKKLKTAPVPPGRGAPSAHKSEQKLSLSKQIAQRVLEAREK